MTFLRSAATLALALAAVACGPSRNLEQDSSAAEGGHVDAMDRNRPGFDVTFVDDAGLPADVVPVEAALGTGECNTLMLTAPAVADTPRTGPIPAPSGGTLLGGWYLLTASELYGASPGAGDDAGASDGADAGSGDDVVDASDAADDAGEIDGGDEAGEIDGGDDDAGSTDLDAGEAFDASDADDTAPATDAADRYVPDIPVPPAGTQRRAQLLLTGTSLYGIARVDDGPVITFNASAVPEGTGLDVVIHCPAGFSFAPDGYDATPTGLKLYFTAEQRVETYTRQ